MRQILYPFGVVRVAIQVQLNFGVVADEEVHEDPGIWR